eukprot:GEMP01058662.1.p2 GENE.GEMP01058662.1~~GEMP01058662.1.p2  ORF type:complete len:165 (+),score=24.81 GEMP01058662.1:116-610(+)
MFAFTGRAGLTLIALALSMFSMQGCFTSSRAGLALIAVLLSMFFMQGCFPFNYHCKSKKQQTQTGKDKQMEREKACIQTYNNCRNQCQGWTKYPCIGKCKGKRIACRGAAKFRKETSKVKDGLRKAKDKVVHALYSKPCEDSWFPNLCATLFCTKKGQDDIICV